MFQYKTLHLKQQLKLLLAAKIDREDTQLYIAKNYPYRDEFYLNFPFFLLYFTFNGQVDAFYSSRIRLEIWCTGDLILCIRWLWNCTRIKRLQIENYGYLIHLILNQWHKTFKDVNDVELNELLEIPSLKSPINKSMLKNKYTTFFTVFPVKKIENFYDFEENVLSSSKWFYFYKIDTGIDFFSFVLMKQSRTNLLMLSVSFEWGKVCKGYISQMFPCNCMRRDITPLVANVTGTLKSGFDFVE